MPSDGRRILEDKAVNPDDNLRFAGRMNFNLFDLETACFNAGTYLGKKKILTIGGGFDFKSEPVRELIAVDVKNTDGTSVYGVGSNYYIKRPPNKLTVEWSKVHDDNDIAVDIITIQAAFGF